MMDVTPEVAKWGGPKTDATLFTHLKGAITGAKGWILGSPGPGPQHSKTPYATVVAQSYAGPREATFRLELHKPKAGVPPRLRLELNPRKLGPAGFSELDSLLDVALGEGFHLPKMLSTARVTRVDVAVDVIGAAPADLFARPSKPFQKVQAYFGADHELQTMIYSRGKNTSHAKVMVYDRRAHKKEANKPPIYGELAHSRVEVVRRFQGSAKVQPLSTLTLMSNPLSEVAFGWVPALNRADDPAMRHALDALRLRGFSQPLASAPSLPAELVSLSSALWQTDEIWAEWPAAVAATGLPTWLTHS